MDDTIFALATAPGEAGIAVIRISGPDAKSALMRVFVPKAGDMPDHMLRYGHITDGGETVDEAMAVFMAAPATYTREDVAELRNAINTQPCCWT